MFNLLSVNPKTRSLTGPQQRFDMTRSQAEKIVNIAGIGTGDSVLYAGIADRAVETIVTGLGARFVTGKENPWPAIARSRADIALVSIPAGGARRTNVALHLIRCHLRPGGRMVMWMTLDQGHCISEIRDPFLKLANGVGFTSMIVGQLSGEQECKMVVATGILNK